MATVKLDPAKGVQIPNLTTTERNAVSSPETGALIWNTTTSEINQYNGSAWEITYTDTNTQADITGKLNLSGGTMTGDLTVNAAAVFNETGADVDFRVESDTRTHALFVQGSDGNVGIGMTPDDARLQVSGGVFLGDAATDATIDNNLTGGGLDVAVGSGTKAFQVWDDGSPSTPRFSVLRDGRGLSDFTAFAWCHFSGSGTPSFWGNAYHNINSITDLSTGNWRVNFVNNASDANNCAVVSGQGGNNAAADGWNTAYVQVTCRSNNGNNTEQDVGRLNVAVFRRYT